MFDNNVNNFQIFDASVGQSSGTLFSGTNQWYNPELQQGAKLGMNCIADYAGAAPSPPKIQLAGEPTCDCGVAPTNGPEPTNGPQPTNKPPVTNDPGDPGTGPYNYGEVLKKSIMFYEAQRSGWLPDNNRIHYRGNSATGDGQDVGLDLTGGWYDAGDHVKFGFPMAQTATTLLYGITEYWESYLNAGQLDIMRDSVRWSLTWFMRAHPSPNELYIQIGDGDADHAFWGRPEEMSMNRPAIKLDASNGGSDIAGETAAALAAGYIVFQDIDPGFADDCLRHARELYDFAKNYRAKYSDSFPPAQSYYGSTGYGDELCWSAAWLYRATWEVGYLTEAESFYDQFDVGKLPWAFSWDAKAAGAQILLYQLTGNDKYGKDVMSFLDSWLPGGGITYTPKGLAWRDTWGPNRYAGNTAFIASLAADAGLKTTEYQNFAKSQINYMLGDGGRSYVIGFGKNPPNAPHHRSSSCFNQPSTCNWDNFYMGGANPQELTGALVGGPNQYDEFYNDRTDYIMNEVATDYNAGFQSAVAGVAAMYA